MTWFTRLRVRLRQLFWRAAADERMDEEIQYHIELETEKNIRQGMSPADARRRALIAFGGVETHRVKLREGRRLVLLEDFWLDMRYALRSLQHNASWAMFAVVIVGVGIGASVTVFSLVNALLLRPLPFQEPERLVWISNGDAHDLSARTVQVTHVWTLQSESQSLADVAGYSEFYGVGDHHLLGGGEPERVTAIRVTENFFPLLGVQPLHGRFFSGEESAWGGPRAALLSNQFWARRFASDPEIVGQAITIDGEPITVVGILPGSFDFGTIFAPGRRIDFFAPYPLSAQTNRQGNTLALVGRLQNGVSWEAAQRELSSFATADRRVGEVHHNAFRPLVRTLHEHVSGAFRPALLVLIGAVGLVMLIVCANLSNLLLTRTAARETEMALRVALGAGRGRLIRQLLTESVLLSSGGALLGLVLGIGGTYLLGHMDALSLPLIDQVRVDWTAFGFAVTIALTTGIVFGLAPALRVSAPAMHEALKETSRASAGRRQSWLRSAIVVSEVTLACMLLVGAGLLMRSFMRVLDVDLGFQPSGTVAVRIDPNAAFTSAEARNAYYDDALLRVSATAGIDAAGLTDVLPFQFNRMWNVGDAGRSYERGQKPHAFVRIVSDGFIRAMGIPVLAGRDFSADDNPSARPVIIINDALARALWPGEDPIGRVVNTGENREREVVGVVASTRHQTLEEEAGPEMYIPMRQSQDYGAPGGTGKAAVHVVAQGTVEPAAIVSSVRSALRPMDATLPMTEVRVIQDLVDRSVSPRRIIVMLLTGFAIFALVLASLGIYGVISYGVTQRRREIGIRIALGETAGTLQTRILMQTMKLAVGGMVLGLVASWALGRVLQNLLFGVTFSDPVTFVAAMALLSLMAVLAGWLPARRAARVDPMEALRAG